MGPSSELLVDKDDGERDVYSKARLEMANFILQYILQYSLTGGLRKGTCTEYR